VALNQGEGHYREQTVEIARREGLTRARVTQVLGLVRMAPEIQEHILALPETAGRPAISERALRPVARIPRTRDQLHAFQQLLTRSGAAPRVDC
jgi:hypothetical protein